MTSADNSPFVPGAKVAIVTQLGWRAPNGFKAGTVAKVYKNGNFTLVGAPQQWRPHSPSSYEPFWRASATGQSGGHLRIWDDTTAQEIKRMIGRAARYKKFTNARFTIERAAFSDLVTDEITEQLAEIAAAIEPKKERAA